MNKAKLFFKKHWWLIIVILFVAYIVYDKFSKQIKEAKARQKPLELTKIQQKEQGVDLRGLEKAELINYLTDLANENLEVAVETASNAKYNARVLKYGIGTTTEYNPNRVTFWLSENEKLDKVTVG